MKAILIGICVSVFLLLGTMSAHAQNARISGQVTDPQGAVIAKASVRITNQETKVELETSTDEAGQYAFSFLQAGQYQLTIKSEGFTAWETQVSLGMGQVLQLDAAMALGTNKSEVQVEGNVVTTVETQSAEVTGTITGREVPALGLNGRNFTQLAALVPGVSNQTGQDEARVGMAGSVSFSVNGGRTEYNSFQVDGSETMNTGIYRDKTSLIVTPSIDAIQEIKVLTSNYGAMYPSAGSGTTIVTTKSGTDKFHGTAYEFMRNEFMNAKGYFDVGNRAPLYRRHDFGFTLGGPVFIPRVYDTDRKNKTHFFFSEEVRLEADPYAYRQGVPSDAERNGDFSDVCPYLPPGSGQTDFRRAQYPDCPSIGPSLINAGLYTTYPNNRVPLDRNAMLLLGTGVIPLPNSNTGCNSILPAVSAGQINPALEPPLAKGSCYNGDVSLPTYWREELFRIDHRFSDTLGVNFRYIHDEWETTTPVPQYAYVQNSFPTIQNRFYGPGINLVARVTKTFSSSLLNEFVASYTNQKISLRNVPAANVTFNGIDLLGAAGVGMTTIFNNGSGGKMPGIVIAGNNQAYGGRGFAVDSAYMPWDHSNPVYSLADNLTKVAGKHTIQAGLQFNIFQRNQNNGSIGAATGSTQGVLTFSNIVGANTTGNSFADLLSGKSIASYRQDSTQGRYSQRYLVAEPYIQDDYKLSPRLTLNVGLRVSLFGTFRELNNNAYNWMLSAYNKELGATVGIGAQGQLVDRLTGKNIEIDPNAPLSSLDPRITNGIVKCGENGIPSSCMAGRVLNSAPRIGFAWSPMADGKTSIRGGYGLFFEHGTPNEANTGSLEGAAPLVLDMTQLNPAGFTSIGRAADGRSMAFPLNVTSIPSKAVWSYVQQWSLSVQRELPGQMLASVAYVGSKGTNLPVELQLNQLRSVSEDENPFGLHQPLIVSGFNPMNPNPLYQNNGDCAGILMNGTTISGPVSTNMLAACYGIGQMTTNPNALRQTAPGIGQIYSIQNIANSSYNALQFSFRRTKAPLTLGLSYTYSHSIDEASDRSDASFVNSWDLKSNRASSSFDQRHMLTTSYVYDIPMLRLANAIRAFMGCSEEERAKRPECANTSPFSALDGSTKRARMWLTGWQVSGVFLIQSGTPFTVINAGSASGISAFDNAGVANGSGAGSYPDLCGDRYGDIPAGGRNDLSFGPLLRNPNAFCAPRGLTFGNAGRNSLRNPGRWNSDIAVLKHFTLPNESALEFRIEAFNVFNHTQFRIFDPTLGNQPNNTVNCYGGPATGYSAGGGDGTDCLTGSAFLHPVSAHRPRTFQLGVKWVF